MRGCKVIDSLERAELEREILGAKWLVWHGKGGKAVARIKNTDCAPRRQGFSTASSQDNLHAKPEITLDSSG